MFAEELQAALPALISIEWVLKGIYLLVGASTAALSPLEWLLLLRPAAAAAAHSVDIAALTQRYSSQNPKPVPLKASPAVLHALRKLQKQQQQHQQQQR